MSIDYRYNAEERIRVSLADHDALNALVTAQIATAEATLALAEQQHIANLIAPKEGDYHEGLEEGIKVGRAGSGPRPITDEMVKEARLAWHAADATTGPGTRMRAALEAAEGARR